MKAAVLLLTSFFAVSHAKAQAPTLPCDDKLEHANAQHPDAVVKVSSFIESAPVERVPPKYPVVAARSGYEGFVQMSFVVDEQGNVLDPVVENYAGHPGFKKAALRAVKDWKYSPAMQNGKPIQQCQNHVQFDFVLGGESGATRKFVKQYRQAIKHLEAKEYDAVDQIIAQLHQGDLRNRYENAWLWKLDAIYAGDNNDTQRELRAIKRALGSAKVGAKKDPILPNNEMLWLMQRRFALELQYNLMAAGLKTFEALSELPDSDAVVAQLQPYVDQVKAAIASDQSIVIQGQLESEKAWFHTLARSKFMFANIQGNIEQVQIRCDARRETYTVAEDNMWEIPQSWGQCRLMLNGEAGTSFEVIEIS